MGISITFNFIGSPIPAIDFVRLKKKKKFFFFLLLRAGSASD